MSILKFRAVLIIGILAIGVFVVSACAVTDTDIDIDVAPTLETSTPTATRTPRPTATTVPTATPLPSHHPGESLRNPLAIDLDEVASASFLPGKSVRHIFEVQFEEGSTYNIDFSLGSLQRADVDLTVEGLIISETLMSKSVGRGASISFDWTAQSSGSYYVKVVGYTPGSYKLTITAGDTARTQTPTQAAGPDITPAPPPSAAALTFASVGAGGQHTCGMTTNGAAYCWGYGKYGSLGNGLTDNQTTPVAVSAGLTFESVSAGYFHNCRLTTGAAAYCWGFGRAGRLGNGLMVDQATPVAVSGGLTFASLSAGSNHTCGVTTSGAALCWGQGNEGVLGDGLRRDKAAPVPVSGGLTFASVSAGNSHTCGVTTSAAAYCWGYGDSGRLGDGDDAAVFQLTPVAVLGGLTFASVSAGDTHTGGVTTGGAAYCWGWGGDGDLLGGRSAGRLGAGAIERRLTPVAVLGGLTFASVSAGFHHTCGVTTSGAAYCWGSSGPGRLGDGSGESSNKPVAVSGGLTFASVIAHFGHTCGVTTSGAAYCWGVSDSGKLGDGSRKHQFTPAAVAPPAGG